VSPWARRASRPIPSIGSSRFTKELNDYSKGMNSFISNDEMNDKLWRLAQNARITTLGEYETRKGVDFHSAAAGETEDKTITSTTGAADRSFNTVTRLAQIWTAGASGRLSKYEIRLKNDASATGTIIVEHWTDSGGSPGTLVARSSIAASALTGSYAYLTVRFVDAPSVTSGTSYWTVVYVQSVASGDYKWSSTSTATTAKTSADGGMTWSATSYALNFKQHYTTSGGVKGLHRAYKSDGTSRTLFAHGTALYSVDDSTGALTTIKSGLNASATHYRFQTVNDIVYYVNGFDGLRKWNFTTESQVSTTNYTHITEHKGLLMLVRKDDPNRIDFSNFADYETFTSTDFFYVPSPKTGDPITALVSLNGYLPIWTLNNKYVLLGDDNATFRLDEAPDQKGTYTQETVVADQNYAYYLSDDGVRRTNGNEGKLLSEAIYQDALSLSNKDESVLAINQGRLYVWHQSAGSSANDRAWVINLNYSSGDTDVVESLDTKSYINRAVIAFRDDGRMLVASSLVGQVYWQELDSNDYTNLGGEIEFILQTHYQTFDSPAVLKQIRYWKPRLGAQSGDYTISFEYATDLRENWQPQQVRDVQGAGYFWGDSGTVWGAFTWGTTAEIQGDTYVPGEYRRIALRYKHFATRQPQKFLGHTLVVQTRRIR
jgi:hypothetical protein